MPHETILTTTSGNDSRLRRAMVLTVALAVLVTVTGFVAPVAASQHAGDEHQRGGGQAPADHERDGESDRQPSAGHDDDGNSSVGVHARLPGPRGGGYLSISCVGTPIRHDCDKDGGLRSGPASVEYDGNNSADFVNRTGGGGDTVTASLRDESATAGFDCTFTEETVTNGTACTATRPGS